MTTTLIKIRNHKPCIDGWKRLLAYLSKTQTDDEELKIETIIKSNGIADAVWCLRTVDGYDKEIKLFAIFCARQVQHLMTDSRSIRALDVAEDYINGKATTEELATAVADADDAYSAAHNAANAYCAATSAYAAATSAAYANANAATSAAANYAAIANAAADAAASATYDASAYEEMRKIQAKELLRICRAKK